MSAAFSAAGSGFVALIARSTLSILPSSVGPGCLVPRFEPRLGVVPRDLQVADPCRARGLVPAFTRPSVSCVMVRNADRSPRRDAETAAPAIPLRLHRPPL